MPEIENIEEENSKDQITNSNEENVNENISQEQTTETSETTNQASEISKSEIENMEVHKHPYHVMHKKKWTEYLLEFFMLFLAVFLGFVAENIREHAVEYDRSKEYAISLIQDLQNDTTAITAQMQSGKIYIAIADSLLKLSNGGLEGKAAAEFSFYARFMYWTVPLIWNRATFEQIKNSG